MAKSIPAKKKKQTQKKGILQESIGKKLSVAIITYNEEKNIKECIESCLEIADEIVILDSISTDKTEMISKSFSSVRFYKQRFKGHIEQKNDAIALCKYEWILSLDADERISAELKNSILTFKQKQDDESLNGLQVSRLTYHMGKFIRYSGWYPQYRYRIFKKGKAVWVGENPHDYISIQGKGSKIYGDIIHYSFQDLSHQVNTINQFSSIVAFTRQKKGKKFSILRTIYKPFSKFIETYFFKFGFLDGFPGWVIAVSSAYSTFLKDAKQYELQKEILERPSNVKKDYGRN
ncbi:glycosyltransferase family 2 protein [Leptospira noguchii]|uniref:glycosyltransferase family 2 protein n=1 Tax=Leptospira noguchii TaxID=28182 RepID=UPI0002BDBE01|nr:glycosyltransferase family 2 protein [Leptospira noguchii]EMI72347.1 glycosyltransferase, group 2 family protein [Leptospira noguchii str. Bonito]EMS87927.1 glycosyltransferase, group 2 family protein [Leptospira noguchii str. Cascata]UOG35625.1 glycosyltransferase family 2 protein [Leptospira noguchii]UOG36435.1 glycosyltransferase family 2 protein [Leptospira noguchii]UOG46555.1 glycosyltransferase family 2 protein [Leptospira noguchii]